MEDMNDRVLVVEDENGKEMRLSVQTFFDFNEEQYAVLCNITPLDSLTEDSTEEEIEAAYDAIEFFIQKVVVNENDEMDFADPDDFSDELVDAAQAAMDELTGGCDCDCDDDDCDCCHHGDDDGSDN